MYTITLGPEMSEADFTRALWELKSETEVTVNLQPGTYNYNLPLAERNGWLVHRNPGTVDPIIFNVTREAQALYTAGSSNTLVRGVEFVGGKKNVMTNSGSSNFALEDCIFRDVLGGGNNDLIKISEATKFLVSNCQVYRPGGAGSGMDIVRCTDGFITKCIGTGIKNTGPNHFIQIKVNSKNVLVDNCHCENFGRGFNIGDENIKIQNSSADGCGYGFCFYDAKNCEIYNCTFSNPRFAFFSIYATARSGELGKDHYSGCHIKGCNFEADAGFLSDGPFVILDELKTGFINLDNYTIEDSTFQLPDGKEFQVTSTITLTELKKHLDELMPSSTGQSSGGTGVDPILTSSSRLIRIKKLIIPSFEILVEYETDQEDNT